MQNLNIFLARYFIDKHENESQVLVVTLNEGSVSSSDKLTQDESINVFISEEADARLIRHAINQSTYGTGQILIKTGDTDVLILAMTYCNSMTDNGTTNFFMDFGVGKHKK